MNEFVKYAPRILRGKKEVKGFIRKGEKQEELKLKEALEFFCDRLKKESSANAKDDTEAEYAVSVKVITPEMPFRKEWPIYMEYEVYIG